MSGETTYDLGDPAFLKAPQHMLAQMRAEGSFVPIRLPVLGRILVTTTHFATAQVAKGKDTFFLTGAGAGLKKKGNVSVAWWMPRTFRSIANNMLGKDDPEHRRLRKFVDQAFARRGIREMRAEIAAESMKRVTLLSSGEVDIVPGLCRRMPLEVIAQLLGIPEKERDTFAQFGGALGEFEGFSSLVRIMWSMTRLRRYLSLLIRQMRHDPHPGLIADLIALEEGNDRLSEEELLAMVFLLLFAGFETTTNLISGAVLALEQNPEQKAWLFEDFDARIERAGEELLRHVSSVAGTKPRIAARDVEIDGYLVKRGEKVMALPIAANYDPKVFENPAELNLNRFPNPHLSFSTGAHFCLGMQLARVELQEALRAVYAVYPNLRLAAAEQTYHRRPGHRTLQGLRLHLA